MPEFSDDDRATRAKARRAQLIEVLTACTCDYPSGRYRNMHGHADACPSGDVWRRQNNLPPDTTSYRERNRR